VDYVHKRKFPTLGPLLTWTLRATTLAVGVGVYQFNTNDIGACPHLQLHVRARESVLVLSLSPAASFTTDVCLPGLTELIRRVWTA